MSDPLLRRILSTDSYKAPTRVIPLVVGGFVEAPGDLGFCRLLSIDGQSATVQYFYNASRKETAIYPVHALKRGYIGPQTRVYCQMDGRQRVGRVVDFHLRDDKIVEYSIRFPNSASAVMREIDINVRCWAAVSEPQIILAEEAGESQFLHDRRRAASERIVGTLSAAQGMSALLSSSIQLVPHQVAAVRRVLSDPVQRYLLADEVGMGKTIEAGIILRQVLLDRPNRRVRVLVPPNLRWQWESELRNKFRSQDFPNAIEVCPYSEAEGPAPDLLVIDEAHRIIGNEQIRRLAHDSKRLLLLSATPVLGNEFAFLSLLNLLDPINNRLDSVDSFTRKVSERQAYGRLILGLQPQTITFVLKQRLDEAERQCQGDPTAEALIANARARLNDSVADRNEAFRALQFYIADVFRIHQRVIRSRRVDARPTDFNSRQIQTHAALSPRQTRPTVEVCEAGYFPDLASAIEDWRSALLTATEGQDRTDRLNAALAYFAVVEAAGVSLNATVKLLDSRSEEFPLTNSLLSELRRIHEMSAETSDSDLVDQMIQALRIMRDGLKHGAERPIKIVAFCSDDTLAEKLAKKLSERELRILSDLDDGIVHSFETDDRAWLLIADRRAEEGLNIAFAHAIFHADVPFSIERMEQRIGRLDRFGRVNSGIRQRVVIPNDDDGSVWDAWVRVLTDSFEIFSRSVSSFQFLLSEFQGDLALACYEKGAAGLLEAGNAMKARLEAEQKAQEEQSALDQVALFDDSDEFYFAKIERSDSDESRLQEDMEGWVLQVMGLQKRPSTWPNIDPFRLGWTSSTLTPKVPWESFFGPDLDRPLTWKRSVSATVRGTALLRQGTPLVDACARYMRWDDRGTAFATWRVCPGLGDVGDAWTGFRMCLIIEPGLPIGDFPLAAGDENGLARRCQAYLPTSTRTIYLATTGELVDDPGLLDLLERPYVNRKGKESAVDINLSSRMRLIEQVLDLSKFRRLCLEAAESAVRVVSEDSSYLETIRIARAQFETDAARHEAAVARRIALAPQNVDIVNQDFETNQLIRSALGKPRIRLDAFGFFVLCGVRPTDET
jgi:ATP-dependent helicase HepA